MQAVAELMGKGLDVKLGHRAVEVDYKGSGVQVSCDNGIVLDADYVICTVSLGVLKVSSAARPSLYHVYSGLPGSEVLQQSLRASGSWAFSACRGSVRPSCLGGPRH